MPIGSIMSETTKMWLYISGTCFWCGLIGTIWLSIRINLYRKKSKYFNENSEIKKQFGLIKFFQNKIATVADIVMFISILALIIEILWINKVMVLYVTIAVLVFSFGMHCMLNGIDYRFINYKDRRDEEK